MSSVFSVMPADSWGNPFRVKENTRNEFLDQNATTFQVLVENRGGFPAGLLLQVHGIYLNPSFSEPNLEHGWGVKDVTGWIPGHSRLLISAYWPIAGNAFPFLVRPSQEWYDGLGIKTGSFKMGLVGWRILEEPWEDSEENLLQEPPDPVREVGSFQIVSGS